MEKMEEKRQENSRMIWDCGSPLYDSYEIASVSNLIERNMMVLPSPRASSQRFAVGLSKFRSEEDSRVKMEAFHEVGFFSKLVGRNLWKRKMVANEARNNKTKKLRRLRYDFCKGFWSTQKKKL